MFGLLLACETGGSDTADTAAPVGTLLKETGDSTGGLAPLPYARIDGAPADGFGNAVDAGTDLNGDDIDDILSAAYLGNRVCAMFGPIPPGDHAVDGLSSACLVGELDTDYAGYGMAAVGDATADGQADVLIGSIGNSDAGMNAGKAYLVAGPLTPGTRTLAGAHAQWTGEAAGDYAGVALDLAGDLTGDGADDLLIGASGFDGEGGGGGGRVYIVGGPAEPGAYSLDRAFASITGLAAPAALQGAAPPPHGAFGTGDFVGDTFAGTHDFDGDGVADLALGASGDQTAAINAGKMAVFFGPPATGNQSVADADVTLLGPGEHAYAGSPLLAVADVTGEGLADVWVSADAYKAGEVYLISPKLGQTSLSEAAITRVEGESDGDLFGYALAHGDLDGDTLPETVITAFAASKVGLGSGAVWVFPAPLPKGTVPASDTAPLAGEFAGDNFGSAVAIAQNEGPALLIGARNSDSGGGFAGRVYLYAGLDALGTR